MTIQELLAAFDLSPNQRTEMYVAYDENPEGFERTCQKAAALKNPPAALTSMIRAGQHRKAELSTDVAVEAYDLDGAANDAHRLYLSRVRKYPPIDENGWREADAITYAVDTACSRHSRFAADDIERELRKRLARPWTTHQDPALHAPGGSPPELLENILNKMGRIGAMPNNKSHEQVLAAQLKAKNYDNAPAPEISPKPADDLVTRLRKAMGEAA